MRLSILVAGVALCSVVHAQDDPIDRARELFVAGVAHFEGGDVEAAIASFSEALSLHDAPTIQFNLAAAHAEIHAYVEAYQRVVAVQARDDLDPDLRLDANRLEERVRPHVGRIDLQASTELDAFTLDGAPVSTGLLVVLPGTHVLEGHHGGHVAIRRNATVAGGERIAVELEVATVREVVQTPPSTEVIPPPGNRRPLRLGLGIAAGSAVLIGVVVVAVIATRGPNPVRGNLEPGVIRW